MNKKLHISLVFSLLSETKPSIFNHRMYNLDTKYLGDRSMTAGITRYWISGYVIRNTYLSFILLKQIVNKNFNQNKISYLRNSLLLYLA